jgi:hypothetical protein
MNPNLTDAEASNSTLTQLESDLKQHRRAMKYIVLMGGPSFGPDSLRKVGPALDPRNDSASELLARHRAIRAAEQQCLQRIAAARSH